MLRSFVFNNIPGSFVKKGDSAAIAAAAIWAILPRALSFPRKRESSQAPRVTEDLRIGFPLSRE
jgi:hypothetical protein